MVNLELKENFYSKIKLLVMRNLCYEVILGHNFLNQHSHLTIPFGGTKPVLQICGLATAKVQYPSLFSNLTSDCKSIAIKYRHYSLKDKEFIAMEVKRLIKENIIEPSKSPWRAQVLITTNENHKKGWLLTIPKPSTDIHSSMHICCPVLTKWFPISLSIVFSAHWILGVLTIRYPSSRRKNLLRHSKLVGIYINSIGSLLGLQMGSQVFKG